jgi:peptide/nickel transport system substrate-binding protein
MQLKTLARRLGVAAFLGSVAFAPAALAEDIVIAIGAEPGTLDPQALDDGPERTINDNIFETILVRDVEGILHPGLAESLPTQVDALTWEVKLRPGLTFTNGEALDAEAVAYSINRILDPELKTGQASYIGTLAGAKAIDATTVHVTTKEPDPTLSTRLYWIKIVPPAYSQTPEFASHPIGSGPYKFVSWARGENVVIEANPDYWGDKPSIDGVTYRFIPDANTRVAGLMSGEIDLITNVAPDVVEQLPKFATQQGVELSYMMLNAWEGAGITEDKRVRQALNYAINKEELAEAIFLGRAAVADGQLLAPTAFGYDPTIKAYPYDPEKAKALLAEAGAEGATLNITSQSGRWLKDRDAVEAIAGYWSAVGLNVNIETYEWSDFLGRIRNREVRPQVFYASSSNELFDADRPTTQTLHPTAGSSSSNTNQTYAELIEKARYETDVEARKALYSEVLKLANEEANLVWLLWHQDVYGLSNRIEWTPRPDGKILVKDITLQQ